MASFTINKIFYANSTGVVQTFRFEYKIWNENDSAYTLISSNATVNPDGTLVTPLTVSGLEPSTLYYIRSANTCNSPLEYFIQTVTTSEIFFMLATITEYGVNYAASMDIDEAVGSVANNSVTFTYDNLPSFCTVTEGDWNGNPLYAYIKYFKIAVAPTGIGDSGVYNFSVAATDGSATIVKNYTLTVDGLNYARFVRPFSEPITRTIDVGDSELWTYSATQNLSGYSENSSYDNLGTILGGPSLRFTLEPIAGQEGQGFVIASIRRTSISQLYSDSILILVTVNT